MERRPGGVPARAATGAAGGIVKTLQASTIAPVDMAEASIGPGMAVFSRYSEVLEADDTPMPVRTALMLINHELDAFLAEQEGEFDSYSRFAVGWFEQFGWSAGTYGQAEVIATGRGTAHRSGFAQRISRPKIRLLWPLEPYAKLSIKLTEITNLDLQLLACSVQKAVQPRSLQMVSCTQEH